MSNYCERCGVRLAEGAVRYLVTIHATADFDETLPSEGGLDDLEAVMRIIDSKNAEELEHDVYQSKAFVLCAACKKSYMDNPLAPTCGMKSGEDSGEGRVH